MSFRSTRVMAHSIRGGELSDVDCLVLENQVIEGMMGQLHLVHNYNNLLIKQWDPGHADTGNGWVAAAAWEQE